MWAALLGLGLAWGAPASTTFTLVPSNGAEVKLFPRVDAQKVEIGVYGNRNLLAPEVSAFHAPWLRVARATAVGDGTTFVEFRLKRDDLEVELVQEGVEWRVRFAPGDPDIVPDEPYPSVQSLLNDDLPRRTAASAEAVLRPLDGDARQMALEPSQWHFHGPPLDLPKIHGPWAQRLTGVTVPGWTDVDRWRSALVSSDPLVLQSANVRLGQAHLQLGLPREASYYLDRAVAAGLNTPALHLARAEAAFRSKNWDRGRRACKDAADAGGEDVDVVECLAIVSLATAEPPPSEVGRALAALTSRPSHKLLAADLMLRDRHPDEAVAWLDAVTPSLRGEMADVAWGSLGDARLALGDLDGARAAWGKIDVDGRLADIARVRRLLSQMLSAGPTRWASYVPLLEAHAASGRPGDADARYLIGQIHLAYGDPASAALAFKGLLRNHNEIARRSDTYERVVSACSERLELLHRTNRDAELVAFFQDCWRDDLADYVGDTTAFERVSHAYERLGLPEDALRVQTVITRIQAANARERGEPLVYLAHLYVETGRWREAIETVAYVRRLEDESVSGAHLDVVLAAAYDAAGQPEDAVRAWSAAVTDAEYGEIAVRGRGLLLARQGRCVEAIPDLQAVYLGRPDAEIDEALVRCLSGVSRRPEALEKADGACVRRADSASKALRAAVADGAAHPEPCVPDAPPWTAVSAEDEEHRSFLRDMGAWRDRFNAGALE